MARAVTITTAPPERAVVLYDGHCRFCKAQMQNLLRLGRRSALTPVSFQDEGALERYGGLTLEGCMEAMHLVTPDGRVFVGMEAAVRAVVTRPILGAFAWLYYLPGLRHIMDAAYSWIAKRRTTIAERAITRDGCEGGTCAVHISD